MRIGMLIIGTELLQGKITDANTVWLAQFLRPWNLRLQLTLTVSDDNSDIRAALKMLYERCDVVICSGGLGPTADDITKDSLAQYFGKKVVAQTSARVVAEANYARFSRTLAADHGYGYLPVDFVALNNPSGFAPGFWFTDTKRSLFAAPGVPKEFCDMLAEHFSKLIAPMLDVVGEISLLNFRTRGVPEERIFKELAPGLWDELAAYGSVSSLPHVLGVDIGVTLEGDVQNKTARVQQIMRQSPVAPHIWHEGHESLEELVVQKAREKNLTFGFAESCTGGLCSHRMTNVSGASSVFWGSVVSYDNSVKQHLLGVKEETIKQHGAVSEATALEMARGARDALGVSIGISLTGIAGPLGGSTEKPVGTVWVGVATAKEVKAFRFEYKGDREILKLRFSQIALYTLMDQI